MNRFSYRVPILGYHRVGPSRPDHVPTVSAEAFERQMDWLVAWQFRVISLQEIVDVLMRGGPLPRHSAVITFDDGYEETCSIAWPILKARGFIATVFVMPAEVGLPGFATWDQLRVMSRDGMIVGSHTMRHQYLPLVHDAFLEEELAGSKKVIEEQLGCPADFLSYPIGGYTQAAQEAARRAGYLAACTTNRARSMRAIDRFALRRIKITDRDANPVLFRVKLSGHYDAFRRHKRPG